MATVDRLEYVLAGRDELTRPLKQAEGQMKRLGNQAQRTNKQMGAFSSNLANARKGTRAFAMGGLQQAGYQIGDFAVQVANGTSRMQAFGQQAPQFLQIFGPIGSVIGAAVAVFAAFGVVAQKTAGGAKNAADALDKLSESIGRYKTAASQMSMPIAQLEKNFGSFAAQIKQDLIFFEELRFNEAIESIREVGKKTEEEFKGLLKPINAVFDRMQDGNAEGLEDLILHVIKLSGEAGASYQQVENLRTSLNDLQSASTVDEVVSSTDAFLDSIVSLNSTLKEPPKSFDDLITKIREARLQAARLGAAREAANQYELNLTSEQEQQVSLLAEQAQKYNALNDLIVMRNAGIGEAISGELKITEEQEEQVRNLARLGEGYQALNDALVMRNALEGMFTKSQVKGGRGGDPREFAPDYFAFLKEISKQNEEIARRNAQLDEERRQELEKMANIPDPLGDLQAKTKLNLDLLHSTEARRQVMEAIFQSERNYTPQQIEDTIKQIDAYNQQVKEMERIKSTADMIGDAFENAFMSMIDGTKSAKDAFKDLTRSIIADLYRQYVVKQITGFITNAITSSFGPTPTGGGGGGKAIGGPVQAGQTYLVGERGPELFRPARSGSITPNDKLGGGGTVVHQTFNFSANGDQSVKQIIAQSMPQIAKVTQNAILDARRRGGQTKQVFG